MLRQASESMNRSKRIQNMPEEKSKFGRVLEEFDSGNLRSSAGNIVTNPRQAKAIAHSVAGDRKKRAYKRAMGE